MDMEDERFILESSFEKSLKELLTNQTSQTAADGIPKGTKLDKNKLENSSYHNLKKLS